MSPIINLEVTDTVHALLRARADEAEIKSLRFYVAQVLIDHVGMKPLVPSWGGWRGNPNSVKALEEATETRLFTKMAARLADDTNYIASVMDNYRANKGVEWSDMHSAFDLPATEQHNLMLIALCRVPSADEPERGQQIREIAQTAYKDDVERGVGVVTRVLREINIDYLINRF